MSPCILGKILVGDVYLFRSSLYVFVYVVVSINQPAEMYNLDKVLGAAPRRDCRFSANVARSDTARLDLA